MADATKHIDALTGLRGLAALLVLGFHAWALAGMPSAADAPWRHLLHSGWLGVDVFFVLSGFLLMRGLLATDAKAGGVRWQRFFALRAARLLPAFHAQLLVLAALGAIGLGAVIGWTPSIGGTLAHAVLWLNAWPWVPAHLGPWWSLAVEAGCYLTLPLLLPMMRRAGRATAALALAALLAVAWRAVVVAMDPSIEQRIGWAEHVPGRWVQFVAGAWLASRLAALDGRSVAAGTGRLGGLGRFASAFGLACLALLLALPFLMPGGPYNGVVDSRAWTWAWPLLTAAPVLGLLGTLVANPRSRLARFFAAAPLRALGVVSYSLYLWHYPVQWWLRSALGGYVPPAWGVEAFLAASLALSLVVAALSWWAIERPALAWARRRARLPAP
jgi:peptidoglycan/LPS O-acetylase OafA/YrhL